MQPKQNLAWEENTLVVPEKPKYPKLVLLDETLTPEVFGERIHNASDASTYVKKANLKQNFRDSREKGKSSSSVQYIDQKRGRNRSIKEAYNDALTLVHPDCQGCTARCTEYSCPALTLKHTLG